jgi:hypothetical protein
MRIFTTRYAAISISDLAPGVCACFVSSSTEPRGRLPVWTDFERERPADCLIVRSEQSDKVEVIRAGRAEWYALRDFERLRTLFSPYMDVYIDVSGLSHHVWIAIMQAAIGTSRVRLVYTEPQSYRRHPSPTSLTAFDLSTEIGGLAPLPGLARLSGPGAGQETIFVAFLGFEGTRPLHLAEQLDEQPTIIIPVVGVPGFRLEYPAVTVSSNAVFLREHNAYHLIRLARTSDPSDAYRVLEEIRRDYPAAYLFVAPVGTKPHTLGAVLYAIDHPVDVEILYDHPKRRPNRTEGVGTVHVYELSPR